MSISSYIASNYTIFLILDNEESLQLACESHTEKRAKELNDVGGKKRKWTKTARAGI